ncbi:DUF5997 family protein [Salinibacterium hongtaonis]|uniref:DUF5997 family protein n=1 Tax=Homoserinimonas hongtaonis TaxID=2079791 RepID=UPI000D38B1F7|nr:DUF5997 family protein [Salinibacterium hongtaonis]AWB89188.1 hypothetical protein C2138_06225 [Salinibacterium hongtaonis]
MISRHDAAQRLDISLEMARKHGLPNRMTEAEFDELDQNPPAWLAQSRANRKAGARPVWVQLTCTVCGYTEAVRPKKWWPEFTYITCSDHSPLDLPPAADGLYRAEIDGIGTRFVGIVDA